MSKQMVNSPIPPPPDKRLSDAPKGIGLGDIIFWAIAAIFVITILILFSLAISQKEEIVMLYELKTLAIEEAGNPIVDLPKGSIRLQFKEGHLTVGSDIPDFWYLTYLEPIKKEAQN